MYRCPRWSERKRSSRKWGRGASLQILVMYSITHGASDTHREVGMMFRRHGRNGGNEGTGKHRGARQRSWLVSV